IGGITVRDAERFDLEADFDSCWIGDHRIETPAAWRDVLQRSNLSAVNGAFAIAWQEPDAAVCLARDQIGERTLFYARIGERLVFGSTVASLLATGVVPWSIDS